MKGHFELDDNDDREQQGTGDMRIIAMIPTYNESENIWSLMDAILALGPDYEVLVVDDNSPDGTWKIVGERAQKEPRIHLLHRMRRKGRGLAGIAGFREALRLGADLVIEMDGDWSHDPKWIPSMIEAAQKADVVIGSRLAPGGGEGGRTVARRIITCCAGVYIRAMLGIDVRDATSGFRVFSRRCLEALPWEAMRATGPEVVQEVLLAAWSRGFRVVEVPIFFVDRRAGRSTFNSKIMVRSLGAMLRLRFRPGAIRQRRPVSRDKLIPLPALLTLPLSGLYGIGRVSARALRVWGILPRKSLPIPVVCVGNMTVGGTGKTPFVQMLAMLLKEQGWKPAILSRGYRASERLARPLMVSDAQKILADAEQAGDEPRWLAQRCPGVPVVVHPDRWLAGQTAIREAGCDIAVLDDGFQHDRLRRDMDIVLWDVVDQPRRMHMLPAGRLREPLGALRRADAIVLTHGEYLAPRRRARQAERVIRQLKSHAPAVPVFEAETVIAGYERVSGRPRAESAVAARPDEAWPWSGRRVLAISGLARPEGFESMIRASGAIVMRHFDYPDHHDYGVEEVDRWRAAMVQYGADLILTTTKDAVKLESLPLFGLTVLAVQISMRVIETDHWNSLLREKLKKQ
ncbi:MAG: tetraacyldisaccharide 4'-kinase [Candidatus Sumerlaeia bacterium]